MPINIATGNVHLEYENAPIPGLVDLVWERRYSGSLLGRSGGVFGPGWTCRYEASLARNANGFEFVTPTGSTEFIADPDRAVERGEIIRNLGAFLEIVLHGGRYVVQTWNVDSGKVWRYCFVPVLRGGPLALASIEDVTGQGLDLDRDSAGRLISIRQRLEKRVLRLDYNPRGLVQTVTLFAPGGETHRLGRYEYDAHGRLSGAFDALDCADRYEYDAHGRLVREIAKHGGVFSYRYDDKGRCIRYSGLDRYDEKQLRFLDGIRTTELTDSLGKKKIFRWRENGQVYEEVTHLSAVYRTDYDEHARIVAKTDPRGATTRFEYDEQGNRSKITDPMGGEYRLGYTPHHMPLVFTDPAGHVWRREYDSANRMVSAGDPSNGLWKFSYDTRGNVIETVSPDGARKRQSYTENGVLRAATDWEGHETRYLFDNLGRPVESIGPQGETTRVEYDLLGHVLKLTLPDGTSSRYSYDNAGSLTGITDEQGHTTRFRYGPCRRLLEKIDRNGGVTSYRWGTEPEHLEGMVNPRGEIHSFTYDPQGRVVCEKGFDGRQTEFVYDATGNCIISTNGAGEAVQYQYDLLGRQVRRSLPDGSSAAFEYDRLGLLSSAVNADSEVRFVRDSLGRIVRETQGAYAIESRFNPAGHLIQTRTNLGHVADYSVDGNGLVRRAIVDGRHTVEFGRDTRGRETTRRLPGSGMLEQDYDPMGRLVAQRAGPSHLGVPPSDLSLTVHRVYQYDQRGSLVGLKDRLWGNTTYRYDPIERVVESVRARDQRQGFDYDRTGNLVELEEGTSRKLFGYESGDRIVRAGGEEFYYDLNGRMVRRVEAAGTSQAKEWRYTWNALDQLCSVQTPQGETWRYAYDPFGRRVVKEGPTAKARFVWDRDVIVHELADEKLCASWVFERDRCVPICKVENGSAYWVISDHIGTPRELVDANGVVVWSASYKAWGEREKGGKNLVDCPFRFQGQWFDTESELHYNRFRYYDPRLGRFISQDPIRLSGGMNFYAYAWNPINWFDPFGLCGGAANVKKGQEGVDRAVAEIEAGMHGFPEGTKVVGREVTLDTSAGRTRPDLVVNVPNGTPEGSIQFVEVKNGPGAGLTPNQTAAFPVIRTDGATPRGANAAAVPGLTPGQPIGPTPVTVIKY